ncbi:uncharacterized protein LOC134771053 isoform X2 [Penaeus indicus]
MYASSKVPVYLSVIGLLTAIVGVVCFIVAPNLDCYGYDEYYCESQTLFLNISGITSVVSGGLMIIAALIMHCRNKNSPEPSAVPSTTAVTYPSGAIYPPTSTRIIYPQVYPPVATIQGYPQIYPSSSTEQGYPPVPPPAYSLSPYPPAYGEQERKGYVGVKLLSYRDASGTSYSDASGK